MTRKKFQCDACDAFGTINYDLDPEYYAIIVCPFCGSELSDSKDTEEDND